MSGSTEGEREQPVAPVTAPSTTGSSFSSTAAQEEPAKQCLVSKKQRFAQFLFPRPSFACLLIAGRPTPCWPCALACTLCHQHTSACKICDQTELFCILATLATSQSRDHIPVLWELGSAQTTHPPQHPLMHMVSNARVLEDPKLGTSRTGSCDTAVHANTFVQWCLHQRTPNRTADLPSFGTSCDASEPSSFRRTPSPAKSSCKPNRNGRMSPSESSSERLHPHSSSSAALQEQPGKACSSPNFYGFERACVHQVGSPQVFSWPPSP